MWRCINKKFSPTESCEITERNFTFIFVFIIVIILYHINKKPRYYLLKD